MTIPLKDTPESDLHNFSPLNVVRPHYEQEQLNNELSYCKPKHKVLKEIASKIKSISPTKCLLSTFPVIQTLSRYSWSKDLPGDLISGCTVAVMHIPQGMGYALLANVPPITGIYMAFFPVLLYFILGTSRHNSMGTFAVISIMVGKCVLTYSDPSYFKNNIQNTTAEDVFIVDTIIKGPSPIQVATAVCFLVGLFQLGMYVFRLGIISSLLSETLVSGFTTGAAIHVFTSQLKDLFGLRLPPITGNFKLFFTLVELYNQLITNINVSATVISVITITILIFNNDFIKPRLAKKCFMPIPIELIAVVGGTLLSKYLEFESTYGIKTIGHIPTGFPVPVLPELNILNDLLIDSFTIAMVSYTVSVSMALIFAQQQNYEIDFNQELLAMGAGNLVGSFFSCMPFSTSLSRSTIQQSVGGKTQIASIISCSLLAIVLLWVGPFFEVLPRCILASVILVALKGMLLQFKQFFIFYKLSILDAIVWMATFLTVVVIAIDIGLLVGIVLSLTCIFIRGMKPYTCLLGNVPNTDLYLDIKRYKGAEELQNISIFHYCGSLNFASRGSFKTELCSLLGLDLAKEIRRLNKYSSMDELSQKYSPVQLKCLILDFSALSYIDPSGTTSLKLLIKEFNKLDILVYLAGSSCPVYEMMKKCNLTESTDGSFKIFPTIHDAVHHSKSIIVPIMVITDVV